MIRGQGRIPRYLDAPITILIWDVDVFIPAFALFLIGLFTHNLLLFSGIAGGYIYIITLYQKKFPNGVMANIMHYWGVYKYKGYPDGYIHTFRG